MKLLELGDVFKTGRLDAEASYVVEKTAMDGGGQQPEPSGCYSAFPDGHHVYARRLTPDMTYDPDGEAVDFWQTGCFIAERMIKSEEILINTTMQMTMTFVR